MFRFANPEYLALLTVPAVMVGVYMLGRINRRRRLNRLSDERLSDVLTRSVSTGRRLAKFVLAEVALTALVLAMARPQMGTTNVTNERTGIEVCFVIDVSNSMRADDVSPSRLERAKLLVSTLLQRMKNDRVALAVFAGEAYPQLPITSDYASAKMFIDALSTDMVTLQGTDIASAIELGCRSFTDKKDVGKAIILITDGENHEGGAEEAAKEANKKGINVYVIGVGTTEGGEIQTPNGPLTDENGQIVHTALNEEMCRKIAQAGHGIYLHLDQSNSAQEELRTQLSQLKQASSTTSYTARNEQFQAIAIIVILLLIIEACLNETKNSFFQRIKLFKR